MVSGQIDTCIIALFHHYFLQFLHIAEIGQKAPNTTASRPPVPCISQILTTFNLYPGRPRMGLKVNNKQKFRQAMVKVKRREWHPLPWPDHPRVNMAASAQNFLPVVSWLR